MVEINATLTTNRPLASSLLQQEANGSCSFPTFSTYPILALVKGPEATNGVVFREVWLRRGRILILHVTFLKTTAFMDFLHEDMTNSIANFVD